MKGRIIQDGKLYLQKEGEKKIRHIENWEGLVTICKELGIKTDYSARYFLDTDSIEKGRIIKEWPEKEEQITIGPMRLMFNVPENANKRKVFDMGITDICSYGTEWMHNQGLDFLNSCLDETGEPFIHVIYSLKSAIHDKIRNGEPWNRASVEGLISRFNDHKAVSGWYILDEPDQGNPIISVQIQREITRFIKDRTNKPITLALRGGTVGWHLADLDLFDFIMFDTYPYDGTGTCWGMEPLDALELVGHQEEEYLKDYPGLSVMFILQCCDQPARARKPPIKDSKVPLGHVAEMFHVMKKYNVYTKGVGFYGHNGGYFGPQTSDEMYQEVKELTEKI